MLDLGTSFLASVARDPNALALVDGDLRLSYDDWLKKISSVVAAFDHLGLRPGDHLVTALQNNWQAATVHWACQFAGLVITPVNWRVTADELDFCLGNSESRALIYQDVSEAAVAASALAKDLVVLRAGSRPAKRVEHSLDAFCHENAETATPSASAEAWSIMLYTSGTTSRPKGVPRRHLAERAAGLAHVAQNLYRRGERTLGVMPLYHTMGVRSLIAMSLIGGTFVCLSRFDAAHALRLIAAEKITNLYLVPTLYHDLLHCGAFAQTDVSSVRKLGFAGASMTDGLLQKLAEAFRPELFVNHYGSSEIYTFTIDQDAPAKPGSAGKAGINQLIRVVKLNAGSAADIADVGEEGEIVALLAGDESFEGYWLRPDADARALRDGWYFTGDTGYVDRDGDIFVTGRVDDMIITGGENVSPVEIESCLSLHPCVLEVAVVGLPDERWGKVVTAFVKRSRPVAAEELDHHCRESGLAAFKRPRRFVFVDAIPKSPVGKLLRRLLVAGEYQVEAAPPSNAPDHVPLKTRNTI
jgi:2-furoate---CoA ligase